jgi:5'-3' exonuclease
MSFFDNKPTIPSQLPLPGTNAIIVPEPKTEVKAEVEVSAPTFTIPENKDILLLIDFNAVLWRSVSAYENLSFHGEPTGGVYGFATYFVKLMDLHKPTMIAVCEDKRPYLRELNYPQFKQNRIKPHDEHALMRFQKSKAYCEEFLAILNVPLWAIQGLEADDLIAAACNANQDKFGKIVIASNDDDFYQLFIYSNVVMQKSKCVYGLQDFQTEFPDVDAKDWGKVIVMSGTHNGLPGLKGVGRKTAIKILKSGKFEETYQSNKVVMDLYFALVKMPYKDVILPPFVKAVYNERRILNFFTRFGITLTQHMRDSLDLLNR